MKKVWYYGVEGVEMIWHGSNADAEVKYDGMVVNEPSLIDGMWELFCDECTSLGITATEDEFKDWMLEHGEELKGDIFDLWCADHGDGLIVNEDEKVFYRPQYEDECDLVGFWWAAKRQGATAEEDDMPISMYAMDENGKFGGDCEGYAEDIYTRTLRGDMWVWRNNFRKEELTDKQVARIIKKAEKMAAKMYEE